MHKFDDREVTIDEIQENYAVRLKLRQETAWVKHIKFLDNYANVYNARLRWDENTGYTMFWDDVPSAGLVELSNRPEFEYVIDSYTEDILSEIPTPQKTINDIAKEMKENEA